MSLLFAVYWVGAVVVFGVMLLPVPFREYGEPTDSLGQKATVVYAAIAAVAWPLIGLLVALGTIRRPRCTRD